LTESGHQIVSDAAKASASAPSTVIDINGMADLGATSTSHRRLSDSRVAAVREELIRDGVVAGDIGVHAAQQVDGAAPLPKDGPGSRVTISFTINARRWATLWTLLNKQAVATRKYTKKRFNSDATVDWRGAPI